MKGEISLFSVLRDHPQTVKILKQELDFFMFTEWREQLEGWTSPVTKAFLENLTKKPSFAAIPLTNLNLTNLEMPNSRISLTSCNLSRMFFQQQVGMTLIECFAFEPIILMQEVPYWNSKKEPSTATRCEFDCQTVFSLKHSEVATISDFVFDECRFQGTRFRCMVNVTFRNCKFSNCYFGENVKIESTQFETCEFVGTSFEGVDFALVHNSTISSSCSLKDCRFDKCKFSRCEVVFTDWSSCVFANVTFEFLVVSPTISEKMLETCKFISTGRKAEWEANFRTPYDCNLHKEGTRLSFK
jgi:uncharacterized protein YjbI with pentapeptide repeats